MKSFSYLSFVSLYLALVAQADTTVNVGGDDYVSYGLKGFGALASDAVDKYKDTISFGSSIALQKPSLSIKDGVYSFEAYGLPDRGYNVEGTNNVISRIHLFDVTFTPKDESSTQNLIWDYKDTILLKDFNGDFISGLDCNTTTEQNGYTLPGTQYHGDGWGNGLNSSTTTTRVCLDSEALSLIQGDISNGFWISDEYGPGLYKFDSNGTLVEYIQAPDAILPHAEAEIQFSSNNPPSWDEYTVPDQDSGRDQNKGYEGMDLSPDGQTLIVLLQSAADQEGGTKKYTSQNSRFLKYDLSGSSPELIGEYVVVLPTYYEPTADADKNPRVAAQSEMRYISDDLIMVLPRDGDRGRNMDETESLFRHVDIYSLKDATNILGKYDGEGDKIASNKGKLNSAITPATYYSFLDINDNDELAKFGLHNGGDNDDTLLNEKWEGITLIPVECTTDEYYLLIVSDNDYVTTNGRQNFGGLTFDAGNNALNEALIFHVKLPGLVSTDELPSSCPPSSSSFSSSFSSSSSSSSSTLPSSFRPSSSTQTSSSSSATKGSSSSSASSSLPSSFKPSSFSSSNTVKPSSFFSSVPTKSSFFGQASDSSSTLTTVTFGSASVPSEETSDVPYTTMTLIYNGTETTTVTVPCPKCTKSDFVNETPSGKVPLTTITTVFEGSSVTIVQKCAKCTQTSTDAILTTYTTVSNGVTITVTEPCETAAASTTSESDASTYVITSGGKTITTIVPCESSSVLSTNVEVNVSANTTPLTTSELSAGAVIIPTASSEEESASTSVPSVEKPSQSVESAIVSTYEGSANKFGISLIFALLPLAAVMY